MFNVLIRHFVFFLIFSPELAGCDSNGVETLSENNPEVPSWPYRLQALTKTTSPLLNGIQTCNVISFPLVTGNKHTQSQKHAHNRNNFSREQKHKYMAMT